MSTDPNRGENPTNGTISTKSSNMNFILPHHQKDYQRPKCETYRQRIPLIEQPKISTIITSIEFN